MTDTTNLPAVKPETEVASKTKVGLRYLASNATGAMSVFVVLGFMTPEQQADVLKNASVIYDSTYAMIGAAANIWYIVFPIIAIWLGKMGIDSSGFGNMVGRVFAAAAAGNKDAKVALINAAASPAIGTQAIVNPDLAPLPTTPGNVVVSPEAAKAITNNP